MKPTPLPPSRFRLDPGPDGVGPRIVRAWDRFWFRPADPLPLGVIRICAGLIILYVHLVYGLQLLAVVGEHGWLDLQTINYMRREWTFDKSPNAWTQSPRAQPYAQGMPIWSIYFHVTDPRWVVAVHAAFMVCMVLFTVGFRTRVTAALTWFAIMSYIHRLLQPMLFGMDTMMNLLVIYLMIGASGDALSVDNLIARWRARKKGLPYQPPGPSVSANLGVRLMQVNLCFIYLVSGLSKLQGEAWWSGGAIWGTMANYSFAPMHIPAYVAFLEFLTRHRWLWELVMYGGTLFTLFVEISFAFLVWRPSLRWLMLVVCVLLHVGIGILMGLATFSMLMMCLLLSFVPADTMRSFLATLQGSGEDSHRAATGDRKPREREPALARTR